MPQHPIRNIMTTRDGYNIYMQTMKTTGGVQFSVKNPKEKLLGRSAALEILNRGDVQRKIGYLYQSVYIENGGKWNIKVPRRK